MKIILSLFIVFACFAQLQAQKLMKKEVPAAITTVFNKTHALARDVDWIKSGNYYEAKYYSGKRFKYITYDSAGTLLKTEVKVIFSSLPTSIIEYMKTNHKDHKVEEASKMTDAKGVITYLTHVNMMDLIFDAKGTFIKSEKK